MIIYKLKMDDFPNCCADCPLCEYDRDDDINYCNALEKVINRNNVYNIRDKSCPLLKVKDVISNVIDKSDELQINDIWDGSGD